MGVDLAMAHPDTGNHIADVVAAIQAAGMTTVDTFPVDAPIARWPSDSPAEFVAAAVSMDAKLVYVEPRRTSSPARSRLLGFALNGIVNCIEVRDSDGADADGDGADDVDADWVDVDADEIVLQFDFLSRRQTEAAYEALEPDEKAVLDAVLEDPRYDTRSSNSDLEVLVDYGAHLSASRLDALRTIAREKFWNGLEQQLDAEANKVAPLLVRHPKYSVFEPDGENNRRLVRDEFGVTDERIVERAIGEAHSLAYQNGTVDRQNRQRQEEARQARTHVPPLILDQAGFSHRHSQHRAILDPYLKGFESLWGDALASAVVRAENEEERAVRESRYATAARMLLAQNMPRSTAARTLRLSTSAFNRILETRTLDVVLQPDDPILVELAPALRRPPQA
jgi:hypothetical protein